MPISSSLQFKIKKLEIHTDKSQSIDVSLIYEEINIYDTILYPVSSGNILITDAISLSRSLLLDGSDVIEIEIVKSEKDPSYGSIKKIFRIYKQTDRKNISPQSESYVLHFVSDELILSEQKRINQHYANTYSQIVESISKDYLKVKNKLVAPISKSSGLKDVVIPNLKPLDAIMWCTKRATDSNSSPNFIFYENMDGFNFKSLSDLLPAKSIFNVKTKTKNVNQNSMEADVEMHGIRSYQIVIQTDLIDRINSGVNSGKFIGFDPLTRKIQEKNISVKKTKNNSDYFSAMKHGNRYLNFGEIKNIDGSNNFENYDSRKSVGLFSSAGRKTSKYIQSHAPYSLTTNENQIDFLFERKSILENLLSKRIKILMPGNFLLTSGKNVDVDIKEMGGSTEGKKSDESISGKYLIISSRHKIDLEKYETIIEVATTTSNIKIDDSNENQILKLKGYA